MRICILTADSNGGYPVPASKGGAVSTLVEHLVAENQNKNLLEMDVVSFYDNEAIKKSRKYDKIQFHWVRPNRVIKLFDIILFRFVSVFMKNKKAISYRSLFSLIYYILYTSRFLKNNLYDKVIIENNVPLIWAIRLSGYKGDFIYHFHNVPRIDAKCRTFFQKCKKYLCVSEYVKNIICSSESCIGMIDKQKVSVLYNCIDTNLFSILTDQTICDNMRKKYEIKKDDFVILFTGRISPEKGVMELLKAVKQLDLLHLKVMIVGSCFHNQKYVDSYHEQVKAISNTLGGNVIFTGFISQEQLPIIYNIADIAVLPSIWEEPAGLTMIEAMSCGLPVITTKSGGITEYVGSAAIILKRDSHLSQNIANAIKELYNSQEYRKRLSENAANHIKRYFSTSQYLENFIKLL